MLAALLEFHRRVVSMSFVVSLKERKFINDGTTDNTSCDA